MLLGGCSASGSFHRPEVAMPGAFRGSVGSVSPSDSSIARLPYTRFFRDSTLVALIDSAVGGNLDLQTALANIDYARQSLHVARLGLLPEASLGASASSSRPSDNGLSAVTAGDKTQESFRASATASWELDVWGKIRSRRKSALAAYLKTAEAARAVRTRLVADVADNYYALLLADRQLETARRNLALADTTLSMMRLQYAAGQLTSLAVQQQDAARQAVRLSVPRFEREVSVRENALSVLCGRMPGPIPRGRPLFGTPITDDLPSGVPASLLENRPDVKQAEMALREAYLDVGTARSSLYPSFTLTAEGGVDALRASDWFTTPGSLFGVVGAGVVQPLFQQGRLQAALRKAKIRNRQAEFMFRQSVIKAVGEVSDAQVALRKLQEQEALASRRASTLRSAVRNSSMLFRSGLATYLEVMQAERSSLEAELELASIRREHLSAMAELYRALGGGWR
ncbi:efflux transporter outer membrane subunit [Chlorobium sp. N1]|nr:efflux transporter outer membrane subunit [Chlorobium sp. N1]